MESLNPFMGLIRSTGELERRTSPRYEPDADLICSIRHPHSDSWHSAAIRDLSATGIALVTDTPFEVESLLTIELRHRERSWARKYLVQVRHSDICYPNDSWLHGCRFVHPLTDADLRLMI